MTFTSLTVFCSLLQKDLKILKKEWVNKFIDSLFLVVANVLIFSYFMPNMGINKSYGTFFLIGAIASYGFVDIIGKITVFIADLNGDRLISYTMTLPITSTALFVYIATYWAINSAILTLPLFFVGKCILYNRFDLSLISLPKLFLIYPTIHLFFGFFSLWLASVIKNIANVGRVWLRVINPLFMFGGFFYSWQAAFALSPVIAYFLFANPMVYVLEGMRAACLGQEGFLPFYLSLGALWVYIFACGLDAVRRLRKILDCV